MNWGTREDLKIKESGNGRRIRDVPKQTCFVVAERNRGVAAGFFFSRCNFLLSSRIYKNT